MEADGDAKMLAGEYEPAAACFSLCLDQKASDPRLLGTATAAPHAQHAGSDAPNANTCAAVHMRGAAGKRATAWLKLGKLSKAVRDAELFVDQCPNVGEAHLLVAQARSTHADRACTASHSALYDALRASSSADVAGVSPIPVQIWQG